MTQKVNQEKTAEKEGKPERETFQKSNVGLSDLEKQTLEKQTPGIKKENPNKNPAELSKPGKNLIKHLPSLKKFVDGSPLDKSPETEKEKEDPNEKATKELNEIKQKTQWFKKDAKKIPRGVSEFFSKLKNLKTRHNLQPTAGAIGSILMKREKDNEITDCGHSIEITFQPGEVLKNNKNENRKSHFSGNEYNLLYSHFDEMTEVGLFRSWSSLEGISGNVKSITVQLTKEIWSQTYSKGKMINKIIYSKAPKQELVKEALQKVGKKRHSKMSSWSFSSILKLKSNDNKNVYENSSYTKNFKRNFIPDFKENKKYFLDDLRISLEAWKELFFPRGQVKALYHETLKERIIGYQLNAWPSPT